MVTQSRTGLNDDGRLAELLTTIKPLPDDLRKLMWFATVTALRKHQHNWPA
jgi:hypothetical protein